MSMNVNKVQSWVLGISSIALIMIVMVILFVNLGNNTGFAANSKEKNMTDAVIGNVTKGIQDGASQFPTIFTFVFLALMFAALVTIIVMLVKNLQKSKGGGRRRSMYA